MGRDTFRRLGIEKGFFDEGNFVAIEDHESCSD
jgi:hypothetical protein